MPGFANLERLQATPWRVRHMVLLGCRFRPIHLESCTYSTSRRTARFQEASYHVSALSCRTRHAGMKGSTIWKAYDYVAHSQKAACCAIPAGRLGRAGNAPMEPCRHGERYSEPNQMRSVRVRCLRCGTDITAQKGCTKVLSMRARVSG